MNNKLYNLCCNNKDAYNINICRNNSYLPNNIKCKKGHRGSTRRNNRSSSVYGKDGTFLKLLEECVENGFTDELCIYEVLRRQKDKNEEGRKSREALKTLCMGAPENNDYDPEKFKILNPGSDPKQICRTFMTQNPDIATQWLDEFCYGVGKNEDSLDKSINHLSEGICGCWDKESWIEERNKYKEEICQDTKAVSPESCHTYLDKILKKECIGKKCGGIAKSRDYKYEAGEKSGTLDFEHLKYGRDLYIAKMEKGGKSVDCGDVNILLCYNKAENVNNAQGITIDTRCKLHFDKELKDLEKREKEVEETIKKQKDEMAKEILSFQSLAFGKKRAEANKKRKTLIMVIGFIIFIIFIVACILIFKFFQNKYKKSVESDRKRKHMLIGMM